MEMPDEFKAFIRDMNDPSLDQAYADCHETPVQFFLAGGMKAPARRRLTLYLDYVLTHPDRNDKASPLWRDIDNVSRFAGTKRALKLFAEMRTAVLKLGGR